MKKQLDEKDTTIKDLKFSLEEMTAQLNEVQANFFSQQQ